jgi:cytochrome c553
MTRCNTVTVASAFAVMLLAGCSAGPAAVSFKTDVKPIIDTYCTECHTKGGAGDEASGFVTETYDSIMKGTKFGPVVVAGDPLSSSLYRLVAGKVDPSIRMPHGKEALSPEEIAKLEQWIEQGAKNN